MLRSSIHAAARAARDVPADGRFVMELALEHERVPAILQIPKATTRVPAALLLHGFTSHKERMADSIGKALLTRGVASLAIDLPLHGARDGELNQLSARSLLEIVQKWRLALREAVQAIGHLERHAAIDESRLAVIGYSLGAFIGVMTAAEQASIRAVVLAAGGDLPEQATFTPLVRAVADPLQAARRLAGRPLLMVNGRNDTTVTPAQAERLYAAAGEPKTLRWYGGGHWLPNTEIAFAAEWLWKKLAASRD